MQIRIRYTNFKKEFKSVREGRCIFERWLYFERLWHGKLICIGIKHYQITLDFRGDLVKELIGKKWSEKI